MYRLDLLYAISIIRSFASYITCSPLVREPGPAEHNANVRPVWDTDLSVPKPLKTSVHEKQALFSPLYVIARHIDSTAAKLSLLFVISEAPPALVKEAVNEFSEIQDVREDRLAERIAQMSVAQKAQFDRFGDHEAMHLMQVFAEHFQDVWEPSQFQPTRGGRFDPIREFDRIGDAPDSNSIVADEKKSNDVKNNLDAGLIDRTHREQQAKLNDEVADQDLRVDRIAAYLGYTCNWHALLAQSALHLNTEEFSRYVAQRTDLRRGDYPVLDEEQSEKASAIRRALAPLQAEVLSEE